MHVFHLFKLLFVRKTRRLSRYVTARQTTGATAGFTDGDHYGKLDEQAAFFVRIELNLA